MGSQPLRCRRHQPSRSRLSLRNPLAISRRRALIHVMCHKQFIHSIAQACRQVFQAYEQMYVSPTRICIPAGIWVLPGRRLRAVSGNPAESGSNIRHRGLADVAVGSVQRKSGNVCVLLGQQRVCRALGKPCQKDANAALVSSRLCSRCVCSRLESSRLATKMKKRRTGGERQLRLQDLL